MQYKLDPKFHHVCTWLQMNDTAKTKNKSTVSHSSVRLIFVLWYQIHLSLVSHMSRENSSHIHIDANMRRKFFINLISPLGTRGILPGQYELGVFLGTVYRWLCVRLWYLQGDIAILSSSTNICFSLKWVIIFDTTCNFYIHLPEIAECTDRRDRRQMFYKFWGTNHLSYKLLITPIHQYSKAQQSDGITTKINACNRVAPL